MLDYYIKKNMKIRIEWYQEKIKEYLKKISTVENFYKKEEYLNEIIHFKNKLDDDVKMYINLYEIKKGTKF